MSYVLFNLISKRKVKSYTDHEGARRGMRCMNRNAGWNRISRAQTGNVEMEWCLPEASASGDVRVTQCGYGPYAIMPEKEFDHRRMEIKTRIQRVRQPDDHDVTAAVVEVEMPKPVEPATQPVKEVKEEPKKATAEKKATPRKALPKREPIAAEQGKKRVLKRGPAPRLIKEDVVNAAKRVERSNKRLFPTLR